MRVWDSLISRGRAFDIHPAGLLALDMARIEAGLILADVDYISSKKALIESQKYSPFEIGLGRVVDLKKEQFVGRAALVEEQKRGPARALVGLELNWDDLERHYDAIKMPPQVPTIASRVPVPVYRANEQIGRATSTTWSPALKKMIALGSVAREHASAGTKLQIEITVEAVRQKITATIVALPFFNPPRKTAVPVA